MFKPITTSVQAFAGQIEANTRLVVVYIDVDLDIGLFFFDHGAATTFVSKSIDDRIFCPECNELPMIKLRA